MMSGAVLALLGIGGGVIAGGAWRAGRRATAARAGLLDPCAASLAETTKTLAPDGFPRLAGRWSGRRVQIALVPDTLTLKRLPQLWLVATLPARLDAGRLAITARPRGDEFVSRASGMRRQLAVPEWLPVDCAVHGADTGAEHMLALLRPALEAAFVDPRLKEIAIGPKGLRLVYQAGEGARGAHLLLRQARFTTPVATETFARCRKILFAIEAATVPPAKREAA